jgi:hypothetical protein
MILPVCLVSKPELGTKQASCLYRGAYDRRGSWQSSSRNRVALVSAPCHLNGYRSQHITRVKRSQTYFEMMTFYESYNYSLWETRKLAFKLVPDPQHSFASERMALAAPKFASGQIHAARLRHPILACGGKEKFDSLSHFSPMAVTTVRERAACSGTRPWAELQLATGDWFRPPRLYLGTSAANLSARRALFRAQNEMSRSSLRGEFQCERCVHVLGVIPSRPTWNLLICTQRPRGAEFICSERIKMFSTSDSLAASGQTPRSHKRQA